MSHVRRDLTGKLGRLCLRLGSALARQPASRSEGVIYPRAARPESNRSSGPDPRLPIESMRQVVWAPGSKGDKPHAHTRGFGEPFDGLGRVATAWFYDPCQ